MHVGGTPTIRGRFCLFSPSIPSLNIETIPPPHHSTTPSAEPQSSHDTDGDDHSTTPGEDEVEQAVVTKANPRLTAHTVQSPLWGAARGWTTLTANKSSVKAIVRDIRSYEGGYGRFDTRARKHDKSGADEIAEPAALRVVDPRSLAEGLPGGLTRTATSRFV